MSDEGDLLAESTERLFGDLFDTASVRAAYRGEWLTAAWDTLVEHGLPLALLREDQGGFGIPPADGWELVRLAGRHAVPLPLAETMVANAALGDAGLSLADGVAALIYRDLHLDRAGDGWRVSGTAERVAWAAQATTFVVEADGLLARVSVTKEAVHISGGTNLAGMPRDTVTVDMMLDAAAVASSVGPTLLARGAVARAQQIAGALERILELAIAHVSEREQFGRPLARFQAIQHELARLGGEVAAAGAAADAAVQGLGRGSGSMLTTAASRIRGGEAVGIATAIAHQLHGAIGYTDEHRLQVFTKALWAWRDEFGGVGHWSEVLADAVFGEDADGFWPLVAIA